MKILILCLLSITAYSQNQVMLVEVQKVWSNRADIEATPGKTYSYTLSDDTARYFIAPSGKTVKATITFTEVTGSPTPRIVDATPATVEFSQGWTTGNTTAPGWYQNTIAYTLTAGSTAKFTFIGTGIELYAERLPTHGTGTVTLAKGTQILDSKSVSFKGDKQLPAKIYEKIGLESGEYTITLTADGGSPILLDLFTIYN